MSGDYNFVTLFPSTPHFDDATVLPQPAKLVGPPPHHPHALLPKFGGMGIGATDCLSLLRALSITLAP